MIVATKHTPGPWTSESPDKIVCANSDLFDTEDGGAIVVATVRTGLTVEDQDRLGCTGANWRLIAAAPELLDACKLALKFWNSDHPNDTVEGHEAHRFIEAVIAKAEGTK